MLDNSPQAKLEKKPSAFMLGQFDAGAEAMERQKNPSHYNPDFLEQRREIAEEIEKCTSMTDLIELLSGNLSKIICTFSGVKIAGTQLASILKKLVLRKEKPTMDAVGEQFEFVHDYIKGKIRTLILGEDLHAKAEAIKNMNDKDLLSGAVEPWARTSSGRPDEVSREEWARALQTQNNATLIRSKEEIERAHIRHRLELEISDLPYNQKYSVLGDYLTGGDPIFREVAGAIMKSIHTPVAESMARELQDVFRALNANPSEANIARLKKINPQAQLPTRRELESVGIIPSSQYLAFLQGVPWEQVPPQNIPVMPANKNIVSTATRTAIQSNVASHVPPIVEDVEKIKWDNAQINPQTDDTIKPSNTMNMSTNTQPQKTTGNPALANALALHGVLGENFSPITAQKHEVGSVTYALEGDAPVDIKSMYGSGNIGIGTVASLQALIQKSNTVLENNVSVLSSETNKTKQEIPSDLFESLQLYEQEVFQAANAIEAWMDEVRVRMMSASVGDVNTVIARSPLIEGFLAKISTRENNLVLLQKISGITLPNTLPTAATFDIQINNFATEIARLHLKTPAEIRTMNISSFIQKQIPIISKKYRPSGVTSQQIREGERLARTIEVENLTALTNENKRLQEFFISEQDKDIIKDWRDKPTSTNTAAPRDFNVEKIAVKSEIAEFERLVTVAKENVGRLEASIVALSEQEDLLEATLTDALDPAEKREILVVLAKAKQKAMAALILQRETQAIHENDLAVQQAALKQILEEEIVQQPIIQSASNQVLATSSLSNAPAHTAIEEEIRPILNRENLDAFDMKIAEQASTADLVALLESKDYKDHMFGRGNRAVKGSELAKRIKDAIITPKKKIYTNGKVTSEENVAQFNQIDPYLFIPDPTVAAKLHELMLGTGNWQEKTSKFGTFILEKTSAIQNTEAQAAVEGVNAEAAKKNPGFWKSVWGWTKENKKKTGAGLAVTSLATIASTTSAVSSTVGFIKMFLAVIGIGSSTGAPAPTVPQPVIASMEPTTQNAEATGTVNDPSVAKAGIAATVQLEDGKATVFMPNKGRPVVVVVEKNEVSRQATPPVNAEEAQPAQPAQPTVDSESEKAAASAEELTANNVSGAGSVDSKSYVSVLAGQTDGSLAPKIPLSEEGIRVPVEYFIDGGTVTPLTPEFTQRLAETGKTGQEMTRDYLNGLRDLSNEQQVSATRNTMINILTEIVAEADSYTKYRLQKGPNGITIFDSGYASGYGKTVSDLLKDVLESNDPVIEFDASLLEEYNRVRENRQFRKDYPRS